MEDSEVDSAGFEEDLSDEIEIEVEVEGEMQDGSATKENVFAELTGKMRDKRQLLMSKIDEIKDLRDKLKGMNRSSVRTLERKKEMLEFKISTEAITLDKERQLMKSIKGLEEEIKSAGGKESERDEMYSKIRLLNDEIELLKNELDEMKLELIKLRDERKKRRSEAKKRREEHAQRAERRPPRKNDEFIVNLEDIAIVKKKG